MYCHKASVYFLIFSLICCRCFAQNTPSSNNALLVKVADGGGLNNTRALCRIKNKHWIAITGKFAITTIQKASLLADEPRMGKWLQVSYLHAADSLPLVTALKKLPFISCVQNLPRQLLPCAQGKGRFIDDSANNATPWYITKAALPALWQLPKKRNIIVAVVDDAVRLTHTDLAGRIWINAKEIPANNKDDDGDGFTDDVNGWDVSDNDNNVLPPDNRLQDFYHGTFIAGEIAVATPRMPGDQFGIYIMPVKCLGDNASQTYLKDGYRGIEYAIKAGADIINCSWGGGEFSQYEKDILQTAADKNVLIVASAGNFPTEMVQYPAGSKNVIGVTGLDENNNKPHNFNYGPFISISAPGVSIQGAGVQDDTAHSVYSGTSFSTPLVSAAAALLMACYPELKAKNVQQLLMAAATPVDALNPVYSGKLGAGLLNAAAASTLYTKTVATTTGQLTVTNPAGYLLLNKKNNPSVKQSSWFVHPYGRYKGLRLYMPPSFTGSRGNIDVYKHTVADTNRIGSYSLQQLPDSVFAAEDSLWVVLHADRLQKDFNLVIGYRAETVDSSCLYCSGTKVFTTPTGSFSDGSKENDYAGRQDCKWLIEVPQGKKITLQFTAFDTEPKVDFVYVFDGDNTSARIIALYSGPNIPPQVTSTGNKMLVWFLTTETVNGKGWEARYESH